MTSWRGQGRTKHGGEIRAVIFSFVAEELPEKFGNPSARGDIVAGSVLRTRGKPGPQEQDDAIGPYCLNEPF